MTTISDIPLSEGSYTNLYTASGITPGTEVIIQNKGPSLIVIQNLTNAPENNSWNGFIIPQLSVWVAPAGTLGLWAKGNSIVAVEVR